MTGGRVLPAANAPNILETAAVLREGGVAVVPTETIYGLAASVFQPAAVDRIFVLKRRAAEVRMPVLVASALDLALLVQDVPAMAWTLIDRFWPGPLTIALPARRGVSDAVTRGGDTVAVRIPSCRPCLALLETLGEPIVATSANLSGEPPVSSAAQAAALFGDSVGCILEADDAVSNGPPSTVIQPTDRSIVVHREGAISVAQIQALVGPRVRVIR